MNYFKIKAVVEFEIEKKVGDGYDPNSLQIALRDAIKRGLLTLPSYLQGGSLTLSTDVVDHFEKVNS